MLNFVICDDNASVSNRLSQMLESLFIKYNLDANIPLMAINASEVLKFIENNTIDVLFLDIDLKSNMSGLDLANKIRKFNKNIYIIFTSAHLEYVLVAYKYKTFDFLPKPLTLERLDETIERLIEDINCESNKNSFIHLDGKNNIINQDSVQFIKKDGMKLVFYTDTKTYVTYSSFNKISNTLPKNFVRCHKSYIANINNINDVNIENNTINFGSNNNLQCFIGPKYKNKFMEVLKNGNFTNNLDGINNRE